MKNKIKKRRPVNFPFIDVVWTTGCVSQNKKTPQIAKVNK